MDKPSVWQRISRRPVETYNKTWLGAIALAVIGAAPQRARARSPAPRQARRLPRACSLGRKTLPVFPKTKKTKTQSKGRAQANNGHKPTGLVGTRRRAANQHGQATRRRKAQGLKKSVSARTIKRAWTSIDASGKLANAKKGRHKRRRRASSSCKHAPKKMPQAKAFPYVDACCIAAA